MKGQIKKTISILLLACFLISLTVAAVSAGSTNGQAKSDNVAKNDKGGGLEVVSITTETNTPTYKVVDDGKSRIVQYAIILD